MSVFDIIVLVIVGILTVIGLWKGMVRQLFGLAGLIAGYMLALRFYGPFSRFLTGLSPGAAKTTSFIIIFLGSVLIAHIIAWTVERFFDRSELGFFNRVGGGLMGFLKGCIIIVVVVSVLTSFFPANSRLFKKSYTFKYILPVVAALKKVTREDIKTKYDEKIGKEKAAPSRQK
jgi:membrane protein required for colicin V production